MRLSTRGRYALRAMVDLALNVDEGPVLRKELAARQMTVAKTAMPRAMSEARRGGIGERGERPRWWL